ncbi:MAG: FeoB-associated Cys-rich membrane protein [Clostridia bacterium]|nr:FeoB-associated Cys-rich membrane protein [Clostridia bacterium]
MENIILILLLVVILVPVIIYIIKARKKGIRCIGCPNKNCQGKCNKSE